MNRSRNNLKRVRFWKRFEFLSQIFIACLIVGGCASGPKPTSQENQETGWKPWTKPIQTESDLDRALEARWTVERIDKFCRLVEPQATEFLAPGLRLQPLIPKPPIWEGQLHEGKLPNEDQVGWYANINPDGTFVYMIIAIKGGKAWHVECANNDWLTVAPKMVSP